MEELASALTTQLTKDRERAQLQLQQLKEAEKQLEAGRPKAVWRLVRRSSGLWRPSRSGSSP